MSNKTNVIEIIKTTKDIELLNYIGNMFLHLQNVIYRKILKLTKEKYKNVCK